MNGGRGKGRSLSTALRRHADRFTGAVTDLDGTEATAISLIENVHLADMHPMDKARAFQDLCQRYGGDYDRASKETGFSVSTIKRYLSLFVLPPELQ